MKVFVCLPVELIDGIKTSTGWDFKTKEVFHLFWNSFEECLNASTWRVVNVISNTRQAWSCECQNSMLGWQMRTRVASNMICILIYDANPGLYMCLTEKLLKELKNNSTQDLLRDRKLGIALRLCIDSMCLMCDDFEWQLVRLQIARR